LKETALTNAVREVHPRARYKQKRAKNDNHNILSHCTARQNALWHM